jgi:chromosome segregation and condensation protein ScpB
MLDRELADLPPALSWRAWMRLIEAVLFASVRLVPRQALVRVMEKGAYVETKRAYLYSSSLQNALLRPCSVLRRAR